MGFAGALNIMTKESQNGGVPIEALSNPQENNGAALSIIERLKSNDIAVERNHLLKINASDGDFTKGTSPETSLSQSISPFLEPKFNPFLRTA